MHPIELADRYYASVRERNIDKFIALFADDAIFVLPDGREISGAPTIREMELRAFAAGPPTPTPVVKIASENSIAVELQVRLPNGTVLRMAAFFQLNGEGEDPASEHLPPGRLTIALR